MGDMIIKIENKLKDSNRGVQWNKVREFTSKSKLPLLCKKMPSHRNTSIMAENIYSKTKKISGCQECKIGLIFDDIEGNIKGLITVIAIYQHKGGASCQLLCDCGDIFYKKFSDFYNGNINTCGKNECVQKYKGNRDWSSEIGNNFDMLTLTSIKGKTDSKNAIGIFECNAVNCISPGNLIEKKTSSVVNGEYNICPCSAWVKPNKDSVEYEIDDGVLCNNLSFAYRYLANKLKDILIIDSEQNFKKRVTKCVKLICKK
ncbi:hypothetical protein [Photobacterium iliopiscarium]|uniref:hypothetical protein n=1 Tax=Photobacterium iliopiscarium TaxID=56192 RepID=UPI001E50FAA0|nr:hypothetical protein [Photobacterium iliopiscarium]MCD9486627.1 hypothetical protein [Photobacterium iliopiscarium]MCF2243210.1 hypothetical protein [Photobacterium iliopiscarium]